LLNETGSTATLSNTLNLGGGVTVTRVGTGEACIKGLSTSPINVQATMDTAFSSQPTNVVAGIVGQGTAAPFTCTTNGSVWVEAFNNGNLADTWNVYLEFVK
jgi:hypothetical protein